jgi:ADP-ribose pyrophosphatase
MTTSLSYSFHMARTARTRSQQRPTVKSDNSAKVLSSRTVFRGKVFSVTSEEVVEPSGVKVQRDTVRHSGSVVIMAVDDSRGEPRVLLARQFRYPAGDYLWELPAGRIDEGEEPLPAAKRELVEETGYTAKKWTRALYFYSSPGFLDETMSIYLAEGLTRGKARPEEDEFITKRLFPVPAAVNLVLKGKIQDAKTIAGILWLSNRISRQSR